MPEDRLARPQGFWWAGKFYPLIAGGEGDGKPQEGDKAGDGGTPGNGNPGGTGETEKFDAAYVKQLREEAARYRNEVKELKEKVKGFESEKLTETEKLKQATTEAEAKATKAESRLKAAATRFEVLLTASRLGCIDPEAAFRLIDQVSITYDDDGNPTNVESLLKDLQGKKTYLFGKPGAQQASGSVTNPASGTHAGKVKPEDLAGMSVDEINRRWAEVQETLKAQR